jgi:transposase
VKTTAQQTSCAQTESAQPDGQRRKPPRRKPPPPSPRRAWQMAMHQQVQELAADGKTQAEIISSQHLHRHTVRKYLQMPTFVAHYCSPCPSPVEPYRAYLEERWHQGEVMITALWQALQGQGFAGSSKSVWTFVRNWPLPAGMTPTSASSSVAASTRRGAPVTRTPRPGEMAIAAYARGTKRQGCHLSAGIVSSFPATFVSLRARPGLCSPDP